MTKKQTIAILGCGNIGTAIARGLVRSGRFKTDRLILTRRKVELLAPLAEEQYQVQSDNADAVARADTILLAVDPQHLTTLLEEIAPALDPDRHTIISIVSGVSIVEIVRLLGREIAVVRAMPNTAIAIQESMTCLAGANPRSEEALATARAIFEPLGRVLEIDEDQISPATSLCACGIAFFLRAIRAASQGGIEIGFHSDEALIMAAQTAKGAAALLLDTESHPESEIDRVTTPRGCTISGLNRMEHQGFSSALIHGIVTSAEKAAQLYKSEE